MSEPLLPTVVIGGYLGAGKTTLVNHLLRQAGGRRVAVLVNDFGDVDIDADLIEATSGELAAGVISLSGGCLCCSFGDDLVETLAGLRRSDPAPDVVLIELSGVALPASVVRAARLAPGIEVIGTLVVADLAALRRQASDRYVGDTVRQQLAEADWVLLNKPDLADEATRSATAAWVADLAPQARVGVGSADAVPGELVFGWRAHDEPAPDDDAAVRRFAGRALAAAPHAAGTPFRSRSLALPPDTDLEALGRALAAPDSGVLRAKGITRDADGQARLLQVTAGRWAVTPVEPRGPGRLVLIGVGDGLERFGRISWARLLERWLR